MGERAGAGRPAEPAPAVRAGPLRLLFAGTPAPALPSLQALLDSGHQVAAVLTRPDAPAGRGRSLRPTPVRELAEQAGVEVLTPSSLREEAFQARLRAIAPDCCPVVAYGALVPEALLDLPRLGWANLHFSLLPAWRGAAPVQHALLAGDETTGASVFRLEAGLDTGPVYGVLTEAVRPTDTAGTLLERLSVAGADLLVAALDGLAAGRVHGVPQPEDGVSLAPKITADDARVDWTAPAQRVDRLVRACTPAPGAWTVLRGRRLKLGPVTVTDHVLPPGAVSGHLVGTATTAVALGQVQPEGKGPMWAGDWLRGIRPEPEAFA